MSAKEFDELIKNKLGQPDFAYSNEDYLAMNSQLIAARGEKSSRKIWLLLTGIAACMLIAIVIAALSNNNTYKEQFATKETITKPLQSQTVLSPLTEQKAEEHAIANKQTETTASHRYNAPKQNMIPRGNGIHGITYQKTIVGETEQNQRLNEKPAMKPQPDNISLAQNTHVTPSSSYIPEPVPESDKNDPYNRKVNISLAGGLNYGSASQGYLLGASVRKNLSNKLYMESDLAYTNSSSTRTLNAYSSAPHVTTNVASAPPVTSRENVNAFSYLQLSPGLGYHIHKKIALGVDADFQRLLQGGAPATTSASFANGIASETGKIIPAMDYGVICKTEYSVSSRLKTGLQYREGMNNFLSNTNKYFDRNYFQVQIKYSLFNK